MFEMPMSSDALLADRQARFHTLVLPHLDRLSGFARRRTGTVGDAEDAVQDACMRAWSAFDELRDENRVRAWLYRILRTVLSDTLKKEGRRRQLVSITRLEDTHEAMVGGDPDFAFTEVVNRIDREVLHAALGTIPEDFAVAVELHDIDGFKYHEIAEITAVPIGTVMSRISRGRRLLAGAIVESRAMWALGIDASTDARPVGRRLHGKGSR
jgi:RNA polymerase sigma-70 factor (ECF subfamily)